MSKNILNAIVAEKKRFLVAQKKIISLAELKKQSSKRGEPRDFAIALKASANQIKKQIQLIAEIKKVSPSAGIIRKDFNPVEIAKIYDHHASAISILTEEKFFQGQLKYLTQVRSVTHIPLLAKDFFIDEYQIYSAERAGADAILLIAAILTDAKLIKFLKLTQKLNLAALVEVHDEAELKRALKANAKIIGINNRNLKTFKIDLNTTLQLAPKIPTEKIIVSESGINSCADITKLHGVVDAVLIGTAFMKAQNIKKEIKKIILK